MSRNGRFSLLIFLFLPLLSMGQDDGMVRKGLLRAQGGFSLGSMPGKGSNVHLDGTLAYYFEDRFSYRGDLFFLLPEASETAFDHYYSFFSGFAYHFRKDVNFDPYVGLQPGLGYSHYAGSLEDEKGSPLSHPDARDESVEPLMSGVLGVQYFGPAVFHLLLECRYVHGFHHSEYSRVSLNEFRFVFGLGLNLNVLDPFWKE